MFIKASEKGQALILIALAAIGLFAFAALAIDGSMAFSDKRHAQNAADTAALAGALKYTRGGDTTAINTIAQERTTENGYDNGDSNDVVITITNVPSGECPGGTPGKDITVTINSFVNTTFARVLGRDVIENAVTATSRACGFYYESLFNGDAVVGLSDTVQCGFDTGQGGAKWKVKGGGIYSNGCGNSKKEENVTFIDPGTCLSLPQGGVIQGNWSCTPTQVARPYHMAEYLAKIMPPNPCGPGGIGIHVDDDDPVMTFSNGVYCVEDFDAFSQQDITLDNATLYVTDDAFDVNFSGSGGFFGRATQAGTYAGSDDYASYLVIVEPAADVCTKFSDHHHQTIEWRGNGDGTFYGTLLAPTACVDLRGNGSAEGMHSQVIGWSVTSNGTADIYVNYKAEENRRNPVYPSLTVLK